MQTLFSQDTVVAAQNLLGHVLVHKTSEGVISGVINEVEAYTQEDPACHTYLGRQTKRNAPMFEEAGTLYIYFVYGMHYCFNIVTEKKGRGCAILIRSVVPAEGVSLMRKNRGEKVADSQLCNGPSKLIQALQIPPNLNGQHLNDASHGLSIQKGMTPSEIRPTTRIGLSKGKDLPWRFIAKFKDDF